MNTKIYPRQDTNLIDVIREKCNSKLMVVGDDWQAIYRFAGSDVSIITDFESLNRKGNTY